MRNIYVEKAEGFLENCVFDGLAHSYCVKTNQWVKPYPEVTGYVINYFLNYRPQNVPQNIIDAGYQLLQLQHSSGGFSSFFDLNNLYRFDTAQILVGFIDLYKHTKDDSFKKAAEKAGKFLLRMQLENGAIVPIYNKVLNEKIIDKATYSIWNGTWSGLMAKLSEAFVALFNLTKDVCYKDAIFRLKSYYENSEYIECSHPLGYWLEGLIAADKFSKVDEMLEKYVLPRIEDNGFIRYSKNDDFSYVSGNIQLGIILSKRGYLEEAKKIREYGRLVQSNHLSGGLFQYTDRHGKLDSSIHSEINSWGTKYFCQLEKLLEE